MIAVVVETLGNSPDSGRIGKAVEYLIASTCILASNAKLNVSTAMVDDEGVDLVFHRRDQSATLSVQVKSRTYKTTRLPKGTFMAEVRSQTFRPRSDLCMLFVAVDTDRATFGPVWLVPSEIFTVRALRTGKGNLRFVASTKPGANDKWREFRLDRDELVPAILARLHG